MVSKEREKKEGKKKIQFSISTILCEISKIIVTKHSISSSSSSSSSSFVQFSPTGWPKESNAGRRTNF